MDGQAEAKRTVRRRTPLVIGVLVLVAAAGAAAVALIAVTGVREAVFVDRKAYAGEPTGIVLRERHDIDFVVTTDGSAPTAPATGYAFPSNH